MRAKWNFIFLFATTFLVAQEPSDEWVGHWINGVELSKNQNNYPKAVDTYSSAIQAVPLDRVSLQLNLINERGNLYFQMLDYPNAIKDFTSVIKHPKASEEQIIEALWGRSKAYLASGNIQGYQKDSERLEQLQFLFSPVAETDNYRILKLNPTLLKDPMTEERILNTLLKLKEIKAKSDLIFTSTGLIIIKKNKH